MTVIRDGAVIADAAPRTAPLPAAAADIPATYRQLHHWVQQGHLRPANAGAGPGRNFVWSTAEKRIAHLMARLVACGMRPPQAARVAREMNGLPGVVEIGPGIRIDVQWAA